MLNYLLAGTILLAVVTIWVFLERRLGPRESVHIGCIGVPGRGCPLCVKGVCVEDRGGEGETEYGLKGRQLARRIGNRK